MQESIGKWIARIFRHGQCFLNRRLEQLGIGGGQYFYLMALYRNDGVSKEELTKTVMVDKATTTKAVRKLESLGLVTCKKDSQDRRIQRVFLTHRGKNLKEEIFAVLREWNDILSQGFSKEERKVLVTFFQKMSQNLETHLSAKEERSSCIEKRGKGKEYVAR